VVKPGDRVKIWRDPITKEGYEGEATVVEVLSVDGYWHGSQLTRVRVQFDDDAGEIYWRSVFEPRTDL